MRAAERAYAPEGRGAKEAERSFHEGLRAEDRLREEAEMLRWIEKSGLDEEEKAEMLRALPHKLERQRSWYGTTARSRVGASRGLLDLSALRL